MKHVMILLVLVGSTIGAVGQRSLFLFIQQAEGKPFYVRAGEHTYSSTAGGHLLVGNLGDSTVHFHLGFPRDQGAEQSFSVHFQGKDRGFELKQTGGRWRLVDLVGGAVIEADSVGNAGGMMTGARRSDAYAELMAGVVGDSAVLYDGGPAVAVRAAESKPAKETTRVATGGGKGDTMVTRNNGGVVSTHPFDSAPPKRSAPVTGVTTKPDTMVTRNNGAVASSHPVDSGPPKRSAPVTGVITKPDTTVTRRSAADIVRFGSENTEEGRLIIYLDRTAPVTDTIRIVIPRL